MFVSLYVLQELEACMEQFFSQGWDAQPLTKEEIQALTKQFDVNNDGAVSKAEFKVLIKKYLEAGKA